MTLHPSNHYKPFLFIVMNLFYLNQAKFFIKIVVKSVSLITKGEQHDKGSNKVS